MKLASQDELRDATLAVARELEKGPPLAFAQIKRAVYGSWGELEEALRREREGQLRLLRSRTPWRESWRGLPNVSRRSKGNER